MLSANFKPKRTAAASRGFLATARLSCYCSDKMLISAGGDVFNQSDQWARFVVITYNNKRQFMFSARRWDNKVSSYICQQQQQQGVSHSSEVSFKCFHFL